MKYIFSFLFLTVVLFSCKKDAANPFLKITLDDGTVLENNETVTVSDSTLIQLHIQSFQGEKKGKTKFTLVKNDTMNEVLDPVLKSNTQGNTYSDSYNLTLDFKEFDCQVDDQFELLVNQDVSSERTVSLVVNFVVK